jgi:hypothetical protein
MMGQLRQVFGLCLIAAVVFVVALATTSWSRFRLAAAQEEAARLVQQETALLDRLEDAQGVDAGQIAMPPDYLWPGQERAAQEIAFQQALVGAAETTEVRLISFGPGLAPDAISTPAVGYEVEVEGGHEELARFLRAIELHEPQLGYSYLWIRQQANVPENAGKALVTARIGVWGFTVTQEDILGP